MKANQWIMSGLFAVLLAIAGAAYAHDGNDGDHPHDGWRHAHECDPMPLSDDKKQLLHETMKKTFEQDKALIEQKHKLHQQMHDILASETFNPQAFMAASAKIEKIRDKLHADRMHAFASIAGQFTPEERVMIAKHLARHHHHGMDDGGEHLMNDGSAMIRRDQAYPPYQTR
jgi:Spy/CpxP family protein refolding chaperone